MSTATPQSEPKLDRDALAAMYEETFRNFEEGTITEGMVVAIGKDKVVVDIGYKSEGMIPADQFSQEELGQLKVGDRLQVYLEECEDADGNLVLSKEKADKMKIWEELEKLHKEEKSIEGKIISRIKGGMMVDIGVKAFLPGSQIDLHPVRDLDGLVGKTFPLKIIKINHRRGNVVVSRRVLLEETRITVRSSIWVGSMACCTSPICRGAVWDIRPSCSRSATRSKLPCSSTIGKPAVSRWASSRSRRIPGPVWRRSTRWGHACAVGW
ncbi:MAG: S1 RNA-binding domain-containing protein [Nitrospira sp. NTP1]|nr:S1 RNA-binding domain-containing protein [Nitrospira sp. NTP1]